MTTEPRDPFDVLTAADPARDAPSFDPASQRGRMLLARAMAEPAPRRRRRGPRFLVVAVAVGAVGAAAAAAYINSREPTETQRVACYETSTGPGDLVVLSIERHAAVEQCRRHWSGGWFAPTPTPERLVACVGKEGNVHVYPGGPEVCARLRLSLAPGEVRTDPEVVALTDRFGRIAAGDRCITPARAKELAEQAIEDAGIDWDVVVGSNAAGCSTFHIEESARQVVIVPDPDAN